MVLAEYRGTRLDQIWHTTDRRPSYRVCIWNPKFDDIQSVVLNKWNGPRYDISNFVEACSVTQNQVFENDSNAVSSRATIRVVIDERDGINVGNRRLKVAQEMFRDGTPIVIYEGDRRIYRDDWPPIFTGIVRGFPGADKAKRGVKRMVQIQAFGRAQSYQRQIIVGLSWPVKTDFGVMATDIAMKELNLEREEILFGNFGEITRHTSNALAQVDKMKGLFEIMRVVGRKPYFDSRGYLVSHDTSFAKPPIMFFDEVNIASIKRIQYANQVTNSVSITGLDHNLVKITSPFTKLVIVDTTIGFFDSGYEEDIYWSEDHTKRAEEDSITRTVLTRNGFGGSATVTPIDEFHALLEIDTGWAPELAAMISIAWVYGEYWAADLEFAGNKWWLWLMRLVNAALLMAILLILTRITRWKVQISGEPFEFVYQEIRAIAVLKGTSPSEVHERDETIHWISESGKLRTMAKRLLARELVKAHAYEIVVPSNPMLEVDDIVEIYAPNYGFDRRARFCVTEISRTYKRKPTTGQMSIKGWFCSQDMP